MSATISQKSPSESIDLLALILIALCFFLPGSAGMDIYYGDERLYVAWSDQIFRTHNFLIRLYDGQLHFAKPPLYNWLVAFAYQIFGVSLFSARFPSMLAGI